MMKKSGLQYQLVRRKIVKAVLKNKRNVNFPVFASIRNILVLAHEDFKEQIFTNQFHSMVKFEAIVFKDGLRPKDDTSAVLYSSDLNFWGIPPKKRIEQVVNRPFDILINISHKQFDVLDYISAKSGAKFKISQFNTNGAYDLIIDQKEKNTEVFLREIIKTINNFS